MKTHLKNYLLPHEGNDHKPHILREVSIIVLVLVATGAFALSTLQGVMLLRNVDFIAAVLPNVLIDLTNGDRGDSQLSALAPNSLLKEAAQLKANHMAEGSYFSHISPDGITPWHWFIEAGYKFTHAGENLAVNFVDSEDVEVAWMNSPGHRANILGENFTEIGIATAEGTFQGRNTIFVVQLFGRPDANTVAVVTESIAGATGETTQPEVVDGAEDVAEDIPELEIIEETETFVSVRTNGVGDTAEEAIGGTEAVGLVEPQSSLFDRFATQPHQLLQWLYIVFGAIMIIVLTTTVLVEVEKQHPRNVVYGLLLLALLLVLIYISRNVIFADLLVI